MAAGDTKVVERGAADDGVRRVDGDRIGRSYLRTPMRRLLVVAVIALAVAGGASAATVPGFHSPSGNIRCLLVQPKALVCQIASSSYAKRLEAKCNGLDWHGFYLSAGKAASRNCSGGILYTGTPRYVDLPYGKSWTRGPFTCRSALTGVTCRSRTGHGITGVSARPTVSGS